MRAGLVSKSQKSESWASSSRTSSRLAVSFSFSASPSLVDSYPPSSVTIMVRLFGHSLAMCPRPKHLKHWISRLLAVDPTEEDPLVAEDGGYESASDGEAEKLNETANLEDVLEEEAQDSLFCDNESGARIKVTKE